ncbi:MAG: formylglycine-generating enzyme family protein, partial [Pseudomonadota bacterium]|nr:formylglycine-generating enzyme family protein [Pseudomonadota bacterium]
CYLSLSIFYANCAVSEKLEPGKVFRDCSTCPEMVVIPPGKFFIGSYNGKPRERPVQKISIEKPLAFSVYEITFDDWDSCHNTGGCLNAVGDRGWWRGKRPVINVLLSDINQYIVWIRKKTTRHYRLPSEAEWEYAARAGSSTEYWWGDKMLYGYANCRHCGSKWGGISSAPVGSFKRNPWGLYDINGNVLEYVSDCWSNDHTGIPANGSPKTSGNCLSRVVKGGAWYYLPKVSRSASRVRNDNRIFSYVIGFRIVREIN